MLVFGLSASELAADTSIPEPGNTQIVQTSSRPQVQIGILENVDPWFFVQMFGPTMEYLREVLPAYDVKSRQYTIQELSSDNRMDPQIDIKMTLL